MVMSSFSIIVSIIATLLCAMVAINYSSNSIDLPSTLIGLEWTLFATNLLSLISATILTFKTFVALCSPNTIPVNKADIPISSVLHVICLPRTFSLKFILWLAVVNS